MDNIEIDDIYHHDFTTASEWEVFIARLEEIIREWKLPYNQIRSSFNKGDFIHNTWNQTTTNLQFADVTFLLKHFSLKLDEEDEKLESSIKECEETPSQYMQDILDHSNDFAVLEDEHLELATYYGLSEFMVLTPSKHNIISDETRIKIILSAITIALQNSNCKVPTFLQVQKPCQKFYLGVSGDRGISTSFDMVHLKRVPSYCTHLNGLLTLFQQKITRGCNISMEPIMVSARFSYVLKDWNSSVWTQEPPDFDFMQGETLGTVELGKLPFGATFDPIEELHLFATWPHMPANVVVDSENYTDLDPRQAPEWSIQVKMMSSTSCLLEEYLTDFIQLCSNERSLLELLGDLGICAENDAEHFNLIFNVLTEPRLSTAVARTPLKKTPAHVGPISDDIMLPILYFLFPDADDKPKASYSANNGYNVEDDQWKKLKTAAVDSLVWRLSIAAAHCAHSLGGLLALAHLWYEFVQEIRFRWEKSILIPGVGPGFPDCVRTCLLHQKLQMLNCCIERNVARKSYVHDPQSLDMADPESESEEEFFECTTEETSDTENSVQPPQREMKHSLWNQPIGRFAKHQSLKLIATGTPLYIPVTQEPVPKTEDQLDNDADVMMELGTDKRASEMRARLMTASLLSDMESFKAANPGALLEDFIRWYSPRDWIETEGFDERGRKKGYLSPRMMIPNNPWTNAWQSAQPVPAHRQKRLFDDTREAEKAIHYLLSQSMGEIGKLLLPVLMHVGLHMLRSQEQDVLPNLPDIVQAILSKLQRATKPIQQRLELYQDIANDIGDIEVLIAQANSLQLKIDDGNNSKDLTPFLTQLMSGKEVPVPNDVRENIAAQITSMFQETLKMMHSSPSVSSDSDAEIRSDEKTNAFPKPTARQFILRTIAPRPTPMSTPRPQRLYASFERDEFRLAAVFSNDTIIL